MVLFKALALINYAKKILQVWILLDSSDILYYYALKRKFFLVF